MTLFPIIMHGYAIFNPTTGLWSGGGCGPKWRKKPKIWSNIGHVKNHLHNFIVMKYRNPTEYNLEDVYQDCVVIDVTTGSPLVGFDIYEYAQAWCEKDRASSKYRANYKIVDCRKKSKNNSE